MKTLLFAILFTLTSIGLARGQNLAGQVYLFGQEFIESQCTVRADCDCCSVEVVFISGTEFVMVTPCVSDQSFQTGTYSIKSNKLTLTYKQFSVDQILNEETNQMTTEKKKMSLKPTVFALSKCGDNKVILSNSTIEIFKRGSRHETDREKETITKLKNSKVWKLISD